MAADFTNPQPGPKPGATKIAPLVPLAQADKERQEMYAPLAEMDRTEPEGGPPFPKPASESGPEPGPEPAETEPAVPEADRQAFLASILGHKPYEKVYVLFGALQATFIDRTPLQVEMIQKQVNKLAPDSELELMITEERYVLATQLKHLAEPQQGRPYETVTEATLEARAAELLLHPKPLYQALLNACREFDRHVSQLTRRALDKDFWAAGMANSPSPRTAPARSTSAGFAATTPIGR